MSKQRIYVIKWSSVQFSIIAMNQIFSLYRFSSVIQALNDKQMSTDNTVRFMEIL